MEITDFPAFDAECAIHKKTMRPKILAVNVAHGAEEYLLSKVCRMVGPVRCGIGGVAHREYLAVRLMESTGGTELILVLGWLKNVSKATSVHSVSLRST